MKFVSHDNTLSLEELREYGHDMMDQFERMARACELQHRHDCRKLLEVVLNDDDISCYHLDTVIKLATEELQWSYRFMVPERLEAVAEFFELVTDDRGIVDETEIRTRDGYYMAMVGVVNGLTGEFRYIDMTRIEEVLMDWMCEDLRDAGYRAELGFPAGSNWYRWYAVNLETGERAHSAEAMSELYRKMCEI